MQADKEDDIQDDVQDDIQETEPRTPPNPGIDDDLPPLNDAMYHDDELENYLRGMNGASENSEQESEDHSDNGTDVEGDTIMG